MDSANVTDIEIHAANSVEENKEEQEKDQDIENNKEISTFVEETESKTECTDVVNANNIVTIVAEENEEGQIFIYERDVNGVEQTENTNQCIEVCEDPSPSVQTIDNSQEKTVEIVPGNDSVESCNTQNSEPQILDFDKNAYYVEKDEGKSVQEIKVLNVITPNAEEKTNYKNPDENQLKNYKNVILEDWDVEGSQITENHETEGYTETILTTKSEVSEALVGQQVVTDKANSTLVEEGSSEELEISPGMSNDPDPSNSTDLRVQNDNSGVPLEGEILKVMADTKADSLKYSKSITKNDIVKILDETSERVVKPIVTGKDLFFSIELTKRLNQKLLQNKSSINSENAEKNNTTTNESHNNNNTVDDRQKIVDILEADEIKDWKSVSTQSKSSVSTKENGNDMEISKAIKNMEENIVSEKPAVKTPKRGALKKLRTMDKELERSLALQQLREEFPTTRKRTKTMKKINHIPFLASTRLEKAMTSPEVSTALKPGPPKRRPCYLPDNKSDSKTADEGDIGKSKKLKVVNNIVVDGAENANSQTGSNSNVLDSQMDDTENTSIANAVVKTYSAKRKSTDAESEIKSTLETIAAVTKALRDDAEESNENKPKKQKTVTKSEDKIIRKVIKKKTSPKAGTGKRNLELEKLLGDEGAVRMLYETQHSDGNASPKKFKTKTTTGLKKDLVLKTKLVKNAVMRLSGIGTEGVYLRNKRFSRVDNPPEVTEEPLFASTPNVVFYKPKKKQRAEASRILYRHSSSESFDSSEGYRRTSLDGDSTINVATNEETLNIDKREESNIGEAEKVTPKSKSRKSELFIRKTLSRMQNSKHLLAKGEVKSPKSKKKSESLSNESPRGSKLNLSSVPVRKSSRPRKVSKKYSIWSSTSMDSLSVESLGLKKLKKASPELGKKLNCKELIVLQYESFVQVVLNPVSTLLKNSLNLAVLEELKHVFSFLSEEDSCKAVLLSSTGSVFCQGIDINHIITCTDEERSNLVSQLSNAIRELCVCLWDFQKPLIAGVQGSAIGLGVGLLPYCDLVVASNNSSFYTPYLKLGQSPEGAVTYTFPRINRHLVSELLLQSYKMSAGDAYKHGLVSRIIPEERFEEDLLILVRNMAAQPMQGVHSMKFLLRGPGADEVRNTLQAEAEMLADHWTTTECLNNMIKFLNSGELQLKQSDHT